jgi:hypothetical protein
LVSEEAAPDIPHPQQAAAFEPLELGFQEFNVSLSGTILFIDRAGFQ